MDEQDDSKPHHNPDEGKELMDGDLKIDRSSLKIIDRSRMSNVFRLTEDQCITFFETWCNHLWISFIFT